MGRGWKRIRGTLCHEIRYAKACLHRRLDKHRPHTCLEDLPIELLEEIFTNACVDGGKTACALARVSSYINSVSRASRFHTVYLVAGSAWQVRRALQRLNDERKAAQAAGGTTPRVRHLCLSTVAIFDANYWPARGTTPLSRASKKHIQTLRQHSRTWATEEDPEGQTAWNAFRMKIATEHYVAVSCFLLAVSLEVETLCLLGHGADIPIYDGHEPRISPETFRCTENGFPRLRELTFSGDAPVFLLPDTTSIFSAKRDSSPIFPRLERLHIAGHGDSKLDLAKWVTAAPALKDARFTLDIDPKQNNAQKPPCFEDDLFWVLRNCGTPKCPATPLVKIAIMPFHRAASSGRGHLPDNPVWEARDRRQRALTECVHSSPTRAVLAWNYQMQDARDGELANRCLMEWRIDNSTNRLLGLEWAARVGDLAPRSGLHDGLWAGPWPLGVGLIDLPPPGGFSNWGLPDEPFRTRIVRNFRP